MAIATQNRTRRPAGRDLAHAVARQGNRPTSVAERKAAFALLQDDIRAQQNISGAHALQAAYAFTSLRHAQARERHSKSIVQVYDAIGTLADRAFVRIAALEAEVAALRGDAEPTATISAKTRSGALPIPARDQGQPRGPRYEIPHSAAIARKGLRLQLSGDITKARVAPLADAIKAAEPDTPIRLTINSRGGNIDAAYDLADVLSRHKGPTHAHAVLDCSSAAVIALLSAKKRTALAGCSFVLHRPSLARRPSALSDERVEGALDNSAHTMARLLQARTGTDADVWRPMLATVRGKRLDSATAVELGIIHGLTRPHEPKKARKS